MRKATNGQLSSQHDDFNAQVLSVYNSRVREIDLFFDFLQKIESNDVPEFVQPELAAEKVSIDQLKAVIEDSSSELNMIITILRKMNAQEIPFEMGNILKANFILLLYNLIEAVVDQAEMCIIRTVNDAGTTYGELSPEWKAIWIKQKPKKDSMVDRIAPSCLVKGIDSIKKYDKKLFGNLDASTIDKLLVRYGIETTKHKLLRKEYVRNGVKRIKDLRSSLSHGNKSFAEIGENLQMGNSTIQNDSDVGQLKKSTYTFLAILLENVETFILEESFKANLNA